jgi:hypothetical protein
MGADNMYHLRMVEHDDTDWIDELSDEQCMEVFWLYVDPPEPFLERYPPALLGQALRFALRAVAERAAPKRT